MNHRKGFTDNASRKQKVAKNNLMDSDGVGSENYRRNSRRIEGQNVK